MESGKGQSHLYGPIISTGTALLKCDRFSLQHRWKITNKLQHVNNKETIYWKSERPILKPCNGQMEDEELNVLMDIN